MGITKEIFEKAMDFDAYYAHIQERFSQGKTTGDKQSPELLEVTKLNIHRIKRGLKTVKIEENVITVLNQTKATNWIAIVEAWCGDAANIVPVVANMAKASENISLKMILRDDNSDIMDSYLTNGARAIPVIVFFDADFNELERWGARPKAAQQIVVDNKENPVLEPSELKVALQKWYLTDKGQTVQSEFKGILERFK